MYVCMVERERDVTNISQYFVDMASTFYFFLLI